MYLKYKTAKEVADRWGIRYVTIRTWIQSGKIQNAKQVNGIWILPSNTIKPSKSLSSLKNAVKSKPPFSEAIEEDV